MMDTKDMELKPCPFCGSKNVIFVNSFAGLGMWVSCNDCGAIGPTCQTKGEAESVWNRRYEPPNEPLTLDELWEMDGEPVWVCGIDGSHEQWMLVDADYCENNYEVALYSDYSKTWLAYRRRPEEGTS